jgi:pilus assembly protein Flp/PilA
MNGHDNSHKKRFDCPTTKMAISVDDGHTSTAIFCEAVMLGCLRFARRFYRTRRGATAIEYGLLAALLAVATLGTLTSLGTTLNSSFNSLGTSITNAG